jgi:hypothetical protein
MMKICTNHVPRPLLCWHDLTAAEQAEFDYLDNERRRESASFFRYRGTVYDLGDMQRAPTPLRDWSGYHSDSYFSGIVFKFARSDDEVIVGTYICLNRSPQ